MNTSWPDLLFFWGIFFPAFGFIIYFSLRYTINFSRQIIQNRKAGLYDDPEFKRRIARLNSLRYTLIAIELLLAAGIPLIHLTGIEPSVWIPVWGVVFAPVFLASIIVDIRWRRLMTRGMQ